MNITAPQTVTVIRTASNDRQGHSAMFHVKHCHVINFPNVENCCMKRTRHAFPIGCRITGIFTPSAPS